MGMAASQARLLSITSRMADNELRSQLINNAKMRLTTDSSKASEKYLAALNKTQLMFSNYNLQGESQYQQLTFNNLTAYSSYNDQYGLINKGGEMLVSELDSARYQAAFEAAYADNSIEEGDVDGINSKALEEFLKSYGLIKDTTYFENAAIYDIDEHMKEIYEGDMVYEYHSGDDTTLPYAERVSGIHMGYEESLKSTDYAIYQSLFDSYIAAQTQYEAAVKTEMQEYIKNLKSCGCLDSCAGLPHPATAKNNYADTYEDCLNWANNGVFDDAGNLTSDAVATAKDYQQQLGIFYHQIIEEGNFGANSSAFRDTMEQYLSLNPTGVYYEDATDAYKREDFTPSLQPHYDDEGNIDYYYYVIDESTADSHPLVTDESGQNIQLTHKVPQLDEEGNPVYDEDGEPVYKEYPVMEIVQRQISEEEYVQSIIDMYRFFQSEVMGALSKDNFAVGNALTAQQNYYDAAGKLSEFIFGFDIGTVNSDYYDNLDDMEWILYGELQDDGTRGGALFPTTALDESEGGVVADIDFMIPNLIENEDLPYQANFQVVKDIYLSEKMMEEYGTPKYTWIDINNPDENADAKAQWYTNLFEYMTEKGYETIENGLASSAEWLQFALESGLISMVQVDVKNQWMSTMYSNCSNITESQVDVDITIAEAEYNKTMNDIEAKDKRYDIELKNIDTEHQSLQTEYDSIKSVIDKNVERNFKMFEA